MFDFFQIKKHSFTNYDKSALSKHAFSATASPQVAVQYMKEFSVTGMTS